MKQDTPHLASLREKLRAREGKSEYKQNCKEIRKEIARLEGTSQEFDL